MLASLTTSSSTAGAAQGARPGSPPDFQHELTGSLDADFRAGVVAPSAAQRQAVAAMNARVEWNAFGTPASLARHDGFLASGLAGDAATVARTWLRANHALFRLTEQEVDDLELLLDVPIGKGHAVMFRQRFDGVPAAADGMVNLAVLRGSIVYVSSSLAGGQGELPAATLTPQAAYRAAAANVGRQVAAADVRAAGSRANWTTLSVAGFEEPQLTRLAALPTPRDGVRPVHETIVFDQAAGEPLGVRELVDAQSGDVLLREDLVSYAQGHEGHGHGSGAPDPRWRVFPGTPPMDHSSKDVRELWCWESRSRACDRTLANDAARVPWDADARTGASSNTTLGNAGISVHNWDSFVASTVGTETATARPNRDYDYAWTNQWFRSNCDQAVFTSPQRNDIDAARANLFAMHNRMHDWSYFLGFTEQTFNLQTFNFGLGGRENDFERGNAQAGAIAGKPPKANPAELARNNANQFFGPDGVPLITNMYVWQPIAAQFYPPCVDGDFDMSVIGHEYGHAISTRMVGGPDVALLGHQANAMGESWSDQMALEYLHEYGFTPAGTKSDFSVGPYVTGDPDAGIRNYQLNDNPLNYSDVGYDLVGPQVHADGEIWSGTNIDLRQAFNRRYDRKFPSWSRSLQEACADGQRPADRCPGNRRWIQIVFDSFLLMPAATSMVNARDAMLAADVLRFDGDNQDLMWDVYAERGLGETAFSNGPQDTEPIAGFSSPFSDEGVVRLEATDEHGDPVAGAKLFAGRYEARVTPVADNNPATPLTDSLFMVPGRYDFVVQAPGRGAERVHGVKVRADRTTRLRVELAKNLASSANGATAAGDGINQANLIDDTEGSNWASLGSPVAGKQVTVRLDPSRPSQEIGRVQVSTLLRPPNPQDPGGDTAPQNRWSSLRQFQLLVCTLGPGVDCTQDAHFKPIFTSKSDAFPAIRPRPRAPQLTLRSFDVPNVRASFLRLRVLSNQCTGGPGYQGEQDADAANVTDCDLGSPEGNNVRVSELQVFRR